MTALLTKLFDRRRNSKLGVEDIRATHACASWLVTYPDDALMAKLPTIGELASGLDPIVGQPIMDTVEALSGDTIRLREQYVDTFDTRRRGCLYLTYFSNGDTRRRGMALVRIKDAYRRAGLDVSHDELPDHLALVLEFSASTSIEGGMKILTQNRAGLELLRVHLEEIGS
ncbi:MAG TPA: nitrate reductase molybdenum cofactor assembly chaperone, partial [Beutenbergiaceae bacterium]|nr:nitrate reductase molybdenum cofactor assembly chaperone [Beutenbergiaceae bacterium]